MSKAALKSSENKKNNSVKKSQEKKKLDENEKKESLDKAELLTTSITPISVHSSQSNEEDVKEDAPIIEKFKVTKTTVINDNTYELLNGLPVFESEQVFAERFKIFERETYIDSQGVGYFCTDIDCEQLELFLRIDKKENKKTILKTEYKFLKAAEDDGKHSYFSQIHAVGEYDDFIYMSIYYKGGPSLKDIKRFMGGRKFTHGTIGRFAHDIFSILQKVHEYGYLLHNLDAEKFTFDACSRNIFLNEYCYVKPDQTKITPKVKDLYKNPSKYNGSTDYSPFYFLEADVFPPPPGIFARDELEAGFYLILDLILGDLPWKSLRRTEVLPTKKEYIMKGKIFEGLPPQYKELWNIICSSTEYDSTVYPKLLNVCKEIYETLGGVTDIDDNYDFEVEPNPEEIPRFILEKKPIETESETSITDKNDSPISTGV
uniref:Protein kinase domain-containing protein n=1 Tax=Parastrongyloides trichosuri TaxID=131310 RepID=A0A0N5A1Q0_PARTI